MMKIMIREILAEEQQKWLADNGNVDAGDFNNGDQLYSFGSS